ncbi:hypothetical protein TcasGA2_TC014349 [Tribolium castaneum]|uniref:Uncharacterized protein n=1 Tax=Tribolium castaneum TaxID=7070 RepID=D6WLG8_TRICA|nr:hypothetical protein TcasGA2_TC014349 [Tribolium castaneum]
MQIIARHGMSGSGPNSVAWPDNYKTLSGRHLGLLFISVARPYCSKTIKATLVERADMCVGSQYNLPTIEDNNRVIIGYASPDHGSREESVLEADSRRIRRGCPRGHAHTPSLPTTISGEQKCGPHVFQEGFGVSAGEGATHAPATIKQTTRLVVHNGPWAAPTPGNDTVEVPKQGRAGPGAPIIVVWGPTPLMVLFCKSLARRVGQMNCWPKGLSFTNRSNR